MYAAMADCVDIFREPTNRSALFAEVNSLNSTITAMREVWRVANAAYATGRADGSANNTCFPYLLVPLSHLSIICFSAQLNHKKKEKEKERTN